MKLGEMMLPEFDQEMANTRKTLERVPMDKFGWKPHEKSMALGHLVTLVAEMPGWFPMILDTQSFDYAPPGGAPRQPTSVKSRQELLDLFERNTQAARTAIAKVEDDKLREPWTLLAGGKPVFTLPKAAVLRDSLNHLIHHRAQLTVYFRLNGVPVPALYGPSADES